MPVLTFGTRFAFGSKAETLDRLAPRLTKSVVPEFMFFSVAEWNRPKDRRELIGEIEDRFGADSVIIRSSAAAEDAGLESMAGVFASIGPVDPRSEEAVSAAIDQVITSYGSGRVQDQVLVQRMIEDVSLSGVAFTQDMSTGAPYYVINYDDESGLTDTVTGGTGYTNRTLYVFREAWTRLQSVRFQRLIGAIREIEEAVEDTNLDIEFALDRRHNVHVFQVRRITTHPNWNRGQTIRIGDALRRIEETLGDGHRSGNVDAPGLLLGNMPDWNPAEMIGTTPRPLALSLYRALITDSVWRRARLDMGYGPRPGTPLMVSLEGQPYIDVQESLYSFLPRSLSPPIATKLVEAWAQRLRDNAHLHDKVEFDIAVTAFAPDFEHRVTEQFDGVLTSAELSEFRTSIQGLTNGLIAGRRAGIAEQMAVIERLSQARAAGATEYEAPTFRTVVRLLEDATELGTLPFAILARHAFVATAILRGLVHRGVLAVDDVEGFRRSVPTVATDFIECVRRLALGRMGEAEVLRRFGHLRPGTYDILSPRYDQQDTAGLALPTSGAEVEAAVPFALSSGQRRSLEAVIEADGYEADSDSLLTYLVQAIQGREYAKFVFTHAVSDLLEVVVAIGLRHGISRQELSFIDVRHLLDAFIEPSDRSIESQLRTISDAGRERHRSTTAVRLPSLISTPSDVWIVPLRVEQPNYITRLNAAAEVIEVTGTMAEAASLDGKIVAIASADPGFDWIFTRPIAGLVTRFGGVNSHMAVRCAEFGLPAAIGCDEQIYERIVSRGRMSLNCADGQIVVL